MKKIKFVIGILAVLFLLCACSNEPTQNKEDEGNAILSVKIKEGNYILPEDEEVPDDEKEGYLALTVEVKNKSDKSLYLAQTDIALYDEEGNKVSVTDVYTDNKAFKVLSYDKISANKSITGNVTFLVDKDKTYELHFEPEYYDGADDGGIDPIILTVDASKYKDETNEPLKAAEAFIDEVFLNSENEDYDELISNDKAETQETFTEGFKETIKKLFNYYDYKPTDEELIEIAEAFISANSKVAELNYHLGESYPNTTTVLITGKLINFGEIKDKMEDSIDEYMDSHQDVSATERRKQAQQNMIQNDLISFINEQKATESDEYSSDGYGLLMTKKDDKWEVDTSSSNRHYEYLLEAFRGGLYK